MGLMRSNPFSGYPVPSTLPEIGQHEELRIDGIHNRTVGIQHGESVR
jgi:hypothetical protein